MTNDDERTKRDIDLLDDRQDSEQRWHALPEVLHAAFDCSKHTSMHEALQALGVNHSSLAGTARHAYESEHGPLVLPVCHHLIERDGEEESLAYWIDAFGWHPGGQSSEADGTAALRGLLQKHTGTDVYVLLLKCDWNAAGEPVVQSSAPDIVMWRLEPAGQQWFVLRRPQAQQSDAKRGPGRTN